MNAITENQEQKSKRTMKYPWFKKVLIVPLLFLFAFCLSLLSLATLTGDITWLEFFFEFMTKFLTLAAGLFMALLAMFSVAVGVVMVFK